MKETIEEILKLAINAPSGNNSQPWKFEVKENEIYLWNIPDKDKIIFNYKQRGSLIAHGALIENIVIIASKKGYNTNVELFPIIDSPDLTAKIVLEKTDEHYKYEDLFSSIVPRTTNRKMFEKIALRNEDRVQIEQLLQSTKKDGYETVITEDNKKMSELAKAFSIGDKLLFDNKYIHYAFFEKVSWTAEEEKKKKEGLYVGTKELPPVMKIIFRYMLSKWNIVNFLNKIKLSTMAAKKRESLYKYCSAMGLVVSPGDSSSQFILSGRMLQVTWLKFASIGLSFQPLSIGLLYLGQCLERGDQSGLSSNQINDVKLAYKKIKEIFNLTNEIPAFSYRIGYSTPPTAHSIKKEPEIKWM